MTDTAKKQNIEAILPLTYMQQGLLFHHLSDNPDQGFLNVECQLEGKMDNEYFEMAWNKTVERHAVLRTTVHWKGLEKPVSIVHRNKTISITYLNWSDLSIDEQKTKWAELKNNVTKDGVDFQKAPLLNLTLIDVGQKEYQLLWPNHHLLIDGWSSQVILEDFLSTYNALIEGEKLVLEPLPSLKSYFNWISKKDEREASKFWNDYFMNFTAASQFVETNPSNIADNISQQSLVLSLDQTDELRALARINKITLNTLIQGTWSFLLSRYFGTNDVIYGTTVSGRSGDFPKIELLTGMFMNVQPVRNLVQDSMEVDEWLQKLQNRQQEARKYEHINLDEITSFIEWPEAKPLFDSLLVFENFPQAKSERTVLQLKNYKSGVTSTYPVTMIVVPKNEIKFVLTVLPSVVGQESANWIIRNLEKIIKELIAQSTISFEKLNAIVPVFQNSRKLSVTKDENPVAINKYVAPRNETERRLMNIWQILFKDRTIGVHDNFFDLGGKSMLAIRLFTLINKEMNTKLLPTTLLEHSTIASIAGILEEKKEVFTGKFVVPIRASGTKVPLFCVHAGMGHVFFYNDLTKSIESDRPVYAVQPAGLYGKEDMHSSIEQMAKDYMQEMIQINPNGPFNIMVYCWSTAVGLEMAIQLKRLGKETNLMIMDTIAIAQNLYAPERTKTRVKEFTERLYRNPVTAINSMVKKRIRENIIPNIQRIAGNKNQRTIQKLRNNLLKIYYAYQWPNYDGRITLMITPETWDERLYSEIITSWDNIPLLGLNVVHLKGHHESLFEEPTVQHTANSLEECIQEFEKSFK